MICAETMLMALLRSPVPPLRSDDEEVALPGGSATMPRERRLIAPA